MVKLSQLIHIRVFLTLPSAAVKSAVATAAETTTKKVQEVKKPQPVAKKREVRNTTCEGASDVSAPNRDDFWAVKAARALTIVSPLPNELIEL